MLIAAIITSTLLYLVNWEAESEKAKTLVMKADLAEALLAGNLDQGDEDSFEPPQEQGQPSPSEHAIILCDYLCTLIQCLLFMPSLSD